MYLGWNFCVEIFRSKENETTGVGLSILSSAAICLRIESLTITAEGEKLKTAPGEVGAGLPQLTAQHNCAALMLLVSQSFVFFLQHSIADIPFSALPAKTGVPASKPEASANSRKSDVSQFFIRRFTICNRLKHCQVYSLRIFINKFFDFTYQCYKNNLQLQPLQRYLLLV